MSRSPSSKAGRRQHRGVRPHRQGGTVSIGQHGSDDWKFVGRFKDPLTLELEDVDIVEGSVRRRWEKSLEGNSYVKPRGQMTVRVPGKYVTLDDAGSSLPGWGAKP